MEQRFAVIIRTEPNTTLAQEIEVAVYPCYREAVLLRRQLRQAGNHCVIRFTGEVGGSD
jgi:hypothetical protein